MEDSHICCTTLGDNVQLFGVFDGHGGKNHLYFRKKDPLEPLEGEEGLVGMGI